MSINLPLILTLAVLITGLIWLYDALVLARPRRAAMEAVDQQFSKLNIAEEQKQAAYAEAQQTAGREPVLVEYAKSFFPVLLVVFVLRSFLVEPFQIPSGSMEPTLDVGDFILVNKYTYGIRLPVLNNEVIPINDPQRGDVMVFFPPHQPETYFIKRVIGLPGDLISYNNHVLTINGEVVPEKLIAELPAGNPTYRLATETIDGKEFTVKKDLVPGGLSIRGTWRVPAGHYFMMGDNRDNSADSRAWGEVSENAIVGKAFAVWMHWDSFFSLPSFDRVGEIQ
ncbi:MAG TPA: signal peptidase I [Cellvibrio sp.]|nr:signal peptidase I [Cellvibrio sp.]